MAIARSRGYDIRYESTGDGPALILVCGFTQWAEQWVSAGYVTALAERFRVIRIDPLGHGVSDKPHLAEPYRWSSVIRDLLAVADAEGLQQPMWWGFSRGADLVQDLAHRHPERVRAAVLGSVVDSFGTEVTFDWSTFPEVLRTDDGLERFWEAAGFIDPEGVRLGKLINDGTALASVVAGQRLEPYSIIHQLDVPALFYKGALERYGESTKNLISFPNVESHEVLGANHSDTFQRSAEVLPFVISFLLRYS
jgi:pimeloyl-ACP methyl ester carboxylesterase